MDKNLKIIIYFSVITAFSVFIFSACNKSSSATPPKELTEEQKRIQEGYKGLKDKKAEYIKIPTKEQLVKTPYVNNKLIFYRYDKNKSGTDDEWQQNDFGTDKFGASVYSKADEKLQFSLAKSPEEVGIIAVMPECTSVKAGSYGSVEAYQEQCQLILVDPKLQAVVYKTLFKGEIDQSKYVGKESSVTAKVDGMDVVDFLSNLQRKSDKK